MHSAGRPWQGIHDLRLHMCTSGWICRIRVARSKVRRGFDNCCQIPLPSTRSLPAVYGVQVAPKPHHGFSVATLSSTTALGPTWLLSA